MIPISHFPKSSEICCVSIGIEHPGHAHCGILYQTVKGSFFLHLANPLELMNEPAITDKGIFINRSRYIFLPFINLHDAKKNLIKTKCIAIAETNKALPYGIYFDESTHFDAIGNLKMGKDSTGLTCSSFVKVVLSSINFKIIDDTDWPDEREDDLIWLEKIIKLFEKWLNDRIQEKSKLDILLSTNMDPIFVLHRTHIITEIDKLKISIKGLKEGITSSFMRFRPEEVAGVCFRDAKEMPFKFEYSDSKREGVGKIGEKLLEQLKTLSI